MRIKIMYTDMWEGFSPSHFYLSKCIEDLGIDLVAVKSEPDYIFFSDFGNDHLHFQNAIKIYVTGENTVPDFNVADYAISYAPITLGDRHFQQTIFDIGLPEVESANCEEIIHGKTGFCNYIYNNVDLCDPIRGEFFDFLNARRHIDAPGRAKNNMTNPIPRDLGNKAKLDFMRKYKFSIAFENSSQPGYTTEKVAMALAADTIPIYWGNPDICQILDPGCFLAVRNRKCFESVYEQMIQLDQCHDAYRNLLLSPRARIPASIRTQAVRDFFANIFFVSKYRAIRRTAYGRQAIINQGCAF